MRLVNVTLSLFLNKLDNFVPRPPIILLKLIGVGKGQHEAP
jgi:hypothetical protein